MANTKNTLAKTVTFAGRKFQLVRTGKNKVVYSSVKGFNRYRYSRPGGMNHVKIPTMTLTKDLTTGGWTGVMNRQYARRITEKVVQGNPTVVISVLLEKAAYQIAREAMRKASKLF